MRYTLYPHDKHVGWICPECGYDNDPADYVCCSEVCEDLREDEERLDRLAASAAANSH